MKAIIKTGAEPGALIWADWPDPVALPGQVVVDVVRAGICSTDVAIYDWTYRGRQPVAVPSVLGHEAAGVVAVLGDGVRELAVGDRIALQVIWGHAQAEQSLLGHENLDPDWLHLGASELGGAFAERVAADADHVVRLPPNVSWADGALLEPLAVAAHALELVELSPGETVALVGPGPFGQIMCQIARRGGASRIVAVGLAELDEPRLEVALASAGVDAVVTHAGDASRTAAEVTGLLGGRGADVVFDCGGTSASLPLALEIAAPAARVAVFGFAVDATIEPFRHVIRKGLRLAGVSAAQRRHYGIALRMLARETIRPSAIVTHALPMREAVDGLELVKSRVATKVALTGSGGS
jgi:threonine dehydrogenase-like Zn-dependent dehydrogenase